MNFSTNEIQVYIVGFDEEKMGPFSKIGKIPSVAGPEQTAKIHEILDCEGIEIGDSIFSENKYLKNFICRILKFNFP